MARLRLTAGTQRTALLLYALLVVLPGAVFGSLLWRQLQQDQTRQLKEVPAAVEDSAARFSQAMAGRIQALLAEEESRNPLDYLPWDQSLDPNGRMVSKRSVLQRVERREGILAWFSQDSEAPHEQQLTIYRGQERGGRTEREETVRVQRVAQELLSQRRLVSSLELLGSSAFIPSGFSGREGLLERGSSSPSRVSSGREFWLDFEQVAVSLHPRQTEDGRSRCADRDIRAASISLGITQVLIRTTPFELRMMRDEEYNLRLTATRVVVMDPVEVPPEASREEFWRCLAPLRQRQAWLHGVILDGDWLEAVFTTQTKAEVLPEGQVLLPENEALELEFQDWRMAMASPLNELGIAFADPADRARFSFAVATNVRDLGQSLKQRMRWFAALVIVMLISLGVGLNLLLSSLRASQEQARRTENFVAAVTHELRTPIAAVRLHGEMLRDGWIKDPERQQESLEHILSASDRLSGLVEQVIDKRRLEEAPTRPEAGDLTEVIASALEEVGPLGGEDLKLDLENNLPQALFTVNGVRAVVINLIENARKYAPVEEGGEPIQIHLYRQGSRVILEVSDRGPGIRTQDQRRAIEPFVRLGDEATRKASGTGLGLHLVAQYARAMEARLELIERDGGGLTVRLAFRQAPGSV
ncbi:MAG TPA: HAMP domain-containing histidine kinase [Planctomycetes bacterium]|nr:HAMP domain-containing histidine kinase [Planctomycetota bacterium]HIL37483.1 HAMP domain-containing histidine kinase [Planctomycetota bacterium]